MEKVTKIKIGLGLVMVGLAGFTVNYLMKQVKLLVNTVFELSGAHIDKISLKEISMTIWWRVVNPSDIGFTVSNQTFDIFLNGKFIKKVGNAIPVKINARSDVRIPTYIVFTPKELLTIGIQNFASLANKEGREKLRLKVTGNLTIKTSIFKLKEFPVNFEDSIGNIMKY